MLLATSHVGVDGWVGGYPLENPVLIYELEHSSGYSLLVLSCALRVFLLWFSNFSSFPPSVTKINTYIIAVLCGDVPYGGCQEHL